jgi:hypothetical protein
LVTFDTPRVRRLLSSHYPRLSIISRNFSAQSNTITIQSTAAGATVNILTGSSPNGIVDVQSNASPADIDTTGGHNNVTLGLNRAMTGIQSTLNVHDWVGTGSRFVLFTRNSERSIWRQPTEPFWRQWSHDA